MINKLFKLSPITIAALALSAVFAASDASAVTSPDLLLANSTAQPKLTMSSPKLVIKYDDSKKVFYTAFGKTRVLVKKNIIYTYRSKKRCFKRKKYAGSAYQSFKSSFFGEMNAGLSGGFTQTSDTGTALSGTSNGAAMTFNYDPTTFVVNSIVTDTVTTSFNYVSTVKAPKIKICK